MIMKIKRWIRKYYLFWRYKHNYFSNKMIVVTDKDRRLGLTTMLAKECIKNKYVLLVPTIAAKRHITEELHSMGIDTNKLVIVTNSEINKGLYRGIRLKVVLDNSCTIEELWKTSLNKEEIVNGFVYCPGVTV